MEKKFNFYLADDYPPYSFCNYTSNSFDGYEYELLSYGLKILSGIERFEYEFKCLNFISYQTIFEGIEKTINKKENVSVFGGITITPERVKKGYFFSIPTIQDNLVALSYSKPNSEFILNSFIDANVSISILLMLIFIGSIFFLFERKINSEYSQNIFSGIVQGFWNSYLIIFRLPFKILSFACRVLQAFTMFTSLFIMILIISSIFLNYTKDDFTQSKNPAQLFSKSAYTDPIYNDIVSSYGIKVFKGSEKDILQGLISNVYDYFISDASFLTNIAQTQCHFVISTVDMMQLNMGVIMANYTVNEDFLRITNQAILLARQNATFFQNLNKKYFQKSSNCNAARKDFFVNVENISDPIDYNTFLMSFIVFIVIFVIALIAKLFERKMRVFFKNKKETNLLIKKLNNVEAQILKKITIFIELLSDKWNNLMKVFESSKH